MGEPVGEIVVRGVKFLSPVPGWHPIVELADKWCKGKGLDVGCGSRGVWPGAVGVELVSSDEGVVTGDAADLSRWGDGSQDYVLSSHSLEHMKEWRLALREWLRVIRVGGHLVLYVPDPSHPPYSVACSKGWHSADIPPEVLDEELSKLPVRVVDFREVDTLHAYLRVVEKLQGEGGRLHGNETASGQQ